jgi:hypothetical protein
MPGRAGGKSTATTAKQKKAKGKSMDEVSGLGGAARSQDSCCIVALMAVRWLSSFYAFGIAEARLRSRQRGGGGSCLVPATCRLPCPAGWGHTGSCAAVERAQLYRRGETERPYSHTRLAMRS